MKDRGASQRGGAPWRTSSGRPLVSVVTAAFNEAENLAELYRRISAVLQRLEVDWEFIVVDDHSGDDSFAVVRALASDDPRVKGLRLASNRGSHIAKLAGLRWARGDCAVALAADLQDPPEVIPELLEKWHQGSQIVWGVRAARPGESLFTRVSSAVYRFLLGRLLGVSEIRQETSSFLALDAVVLRALEQFRESDPHYLGLLCSMGFRTAETPYVQQARFRGSSKWSLGKKLALVRRSIISFSPAPIRIIGLVGWAMALSATLAFAGSWMGRSPFSEWPAAVIAIVFVGGLQLSAIAWIGEYVWRALQEARARPRYLVEESIGFEATSPSFTAGSPAGSRPPAADPRP